MKVGVLCEFSGTVRDAFIERGHDAVSCDILPTESPGPHIQKDCLDVDWKGFDLLICHPPCTYLANSGVSWLNRQAGRWDRMKEAAEFFVRLMMLPVDHIAIENPIMHRYAREIVGRRPEQYVQPWEYGHGETKATGLWLKNLPLLEPTDIVEGREKRILALGPTPDRWKKRSLTYPGIAKAMADQWPPYIEKFCKETLFELH